MRENRVRVRDYGRIIRSDDPRLRSIPSVRGRDCKLHFLAAGAFSRMAHQIFTDIGVELKAASGWRAHRWSSLSTWGSGTGSYTLQAGTTRWRGTVDTDGNWNAGGTITLTITAPGTTAKSGWRCDSLRGAVRYSTISVAPNTITIVMNNISGAVIPAGTAVTVGMLAYEGEEP